MFWMLALCITCFAAGVSVMRRFPQDECLGALADITEAPFKLAGDFLRKKREDKEPAPKEGKGAKGAA